MPGKPLKKKLVPRRETAVVSAAQLQESFLHYLQAECHLAANTVAAYGRDLRRFFEWLAGRRIAQLTVGELSGYTSWLVEQGLVPGPGPEAR